MSVSESQPVGPDSLSGVCRMCGETLESLEPFRRGVWAAHAPYTCTRNLRLRIDRVERNVTAALLTPVVRLNRVVTPPRVPTRLARLTCRLWGHVEGSDPVCTRCWRQHGDL
jgi:hypothetical protein